MNPDQGIYRFSFRLDCRRQGGAETSFYRVSRKGVAGHSPGTEPAKPWSLSSPPTLRAAPRGPGHATYAARAKSASVFSADKFGCQFQELVAPSASKSHHKFTVESGTPPVVLGYVRAVRKSTAEGPRCARTIPLTKSARVVCAGRTQGRSRLTLGARRRRRPHFWLTRLRVSAAADRITPHGAAGAREVHCAPFGSGLPAVV